MAQSRELFSASQDPPRADAELSEVPRPAPRRAADSICPRATGCSKAATTRRVTPGKGKASKLYAWPPSSTSRTCPPKGNDPLGAAQLADLARWIDLGAAYDKPLVERGGATKKPMVVSAEGPQVSWSFRP